MSSDPLIASLLAAVEAAPHDPELRAHLAGLLIGAGRGAEAAAHAAVALDLDPAHIGALDAAIKAHRALGNDARADGYKKLATALGGESPPDPSTDAEIEQRKAVTPDGEIHDHIPDTADELLDAWADTDSVEEVEFGELTQAGVQLEDVGGLRQVKAQLERSFLAPMRNPEMAAAFAKTAGGGLLLWGPPGCGKTFLARATAGEMGANFYNVGLADVLDMWIGSSERNLAAIFETARRNAPCVLFFDEIDALGQKRSHLRTGGATLRGVVNQLLSELDGVGGQNDGVFVLAATNHPWDVDEALLRPGRFDRRLLVLPPDEEARESILRYHLRGRPADGVDLRKVVARTDGYSGADLALIIEEATEAALDASLTSGRVEAIDTTGVHRALGTVKPSIGPWLEVARNHVLYSNRSGDYDELEAYLRSYR